MAEELEVQSSGEPAAMPVETQNVQESAAPAEQPVKQEAAPAEKMIPSSQVSKIAAREARAAADKARAEMKAEFERQQHTPPQTQTLGGMPQMTPEEFNQRVYQAAHTLSVNAQAERIEKEFLGKIDSARMADPEFGELYDALNIEAQPRLVIMTNALDNTADVVKELAKYPAKYSNVMMLMNSGSPKLAENELKSLSSSIKANQEAQKTPSAPPPLSQMKPSNIGTDNGDMGVSDYRKQPWLRG